ncbi:MAG TPA: hypothetical protein VI756_19735 [Blastocatellia bacterium]
MNSAEAQRKREAAELKSRTRQFQQGELFDDDDLADLIAAIICSNPESADQLTLYLLIILDGMGEAAPDNVRRAIEDSVRFAFQSTETFAAALELYTLGQRGLLSGSFPRDSIREIIRSRGLKGDKTNADER